MPPRRTQDEPENSGTAVTPYEMPQNIREELLRAQQGSIQTAIQLPKIKIMPAAAGLYEIEGADDGSQREVTDHFTGVILNNHGKNVLWDRKFGGPAPTDDLLQRPACSAEDGKWGVPRKGFKHAALNGAEATGTEHIECKTCPYSVWGTGAKLIPDKNPKGKAITNYRVLYVMLNGRNTPMELTLAAMSIAPFDEYLMGLLNQSIPVQGVLTEFTQQIIPRSTPVAIAQFRRVGFLDGVQFDAVMKKRQEYAASITRPEYIPNVEMSDDGDVSGQNESDDDGESLPF